LKPRSLPTVSYLRSRLDLRTDGHLYWKPRPVNQFSAPCYAQMWNTRFAGRRTGSDKGNGYLIVVLDGVKYLAHRLAYAIEYGEDPGEAHVDHAGGVRDTSKDLRLATNTENIQHRTKLNSNNTSGVLGVYWHRTAGKWSARIKVSGKDIFLGLYADINDAAKIRRRAEIKYFGRFAPNIKG